MLLDGVVPHESTAAGTSYFNRKCTDVHQLRFCSFKCRSMCQVSRLKSQKQSMNLLQYVSEHKMSVTLMVLHSAALYNCELPSPFLQQSTTAINALHIIPTSVLYEFRLFVF